LKKFNQYFVVEKERKAIKLNLEKKIREQEREKYIAGS